MPPTPTTPGSTINPTEPFVHVAPTLTVASPGAMAIGDDMTILGEDFIQPIHGKVWVHFTGSFIDDQGQATPVDYRARATFINKAKIQWSLWPNVVFVQTGDRLGRFVGALEVINQANDASEKVSAQLPVAVDIKPSIVPRLMQPLNKGCPGVVERTRENVPMFLSVEALGLRPGTKEQPLVFSWTFLNRHWNVKFNNGTLDVSSILPDRDGSVLVEDRVTEGASSSVGDVASTKNFIVKVKDDLMGEHRLSTVLTRTIDEAGNNMPISVAVSAVDAGGKRAKIALRMVLGKAIDMHYDGSSQIAERFPPVQVTDCIPGGDIGRDVNYHETNSESHHRSMTHSYNANLGIRLGLPSNPFAAGLDLSAGFGVNVNEAVSSDKSESLTLSGHIMPGQYGVFYRQTTKVHRVAQIVGFSVCGESMPLGDVVLADWVFTPHLAVGAGCIPPPTELPPAQKFIYD